MTLEKENHGHGDGLRHGTWGGVITEIEREKEAVKKDWEVRCESYLSKEI